MTGFLQYFQALGAPIRFVRNKWVKARNVKGGIQVDINRVRSYKQIAKLRAREAKQAASKAKSKAGAARARLGQAAGPGGQGGAAAGGPVMAGAGAGPGAAAGGGGGGGMAYGRVAPGGAQVAPAGGAGYAAAGSGGGHGGGPAMQAGHAAPGVGPVAGGAAPVNGGQSGIVVAGSLWWKKHLCANCGQELDKTWDRCPYCAPGAQPAPMKTQAIMVNAAGMGNGMQLLGWLVPLKGPQRGELYTLAPITSIGTDPGCTVVLTDGYMSSLHAEIKAEGGTWVLRDLKSTNGTYVNDKRIEQHELVDNDFVKLGQSVLKFKSL